MKRLFKISSGEHGRGQVIVKWQPEGNLLATAGQNGACGFMDIALFVQTDMDAFGMV